MEYISVQHYAMLTGKKYNTAWRYAERHGLLAVTDKALGTVFVKYDPEDDLHMYIPDGWIPLAQWAELRGLNKRTIQTYIWHRLYIPSDKILKIRGRYYLPKDYDFLPRLSRKARELLENRPKGYLTINEWAYKNDFNEHYVRTVLIRLGKIPVKRVNGYIYIHPDTIYIKYKHGSQRKEK